MNIKSIILETTTWEAFQTKLSDLSNRQKGDTFELLANYFLKLYTWVDDYKIKFLK